MTKIFKGNDKGKPVRLFTKEQIIIGFFSGMLIGVVLRLLRGLI